METTESDDDTLEFEIEVVESSSSISLASSLAAEADSMQITCQKVVDPKLIEVEQIPTEEEEGQEVGTKERSADSTSCETSREVCKIQDNEERNKQPSVLEMQPIIEAAVNDENLVYGEKNTSTSCKMLLSEKVSCENELLSENKIQVRVSEQTSFSEQHLIKEKQQVCEFDDGQKDNLGKSREFSMVQDLPQVATTDELNPNSNLVEEAKAEIRLGQRHSKQRDEATDLYLIQTEIPATSTAEINTQAIPNDQQYKDDIEIKRRGSDLEILELSNDKLKITENEKQLQSETVAESDLKNVESTQIFIDTENLTREPPHDITIQPSFRPTPAIIDDGPQQPSIALELAEIKGGLIRESIYPNGIVSAAQSELVVKLNPNYTEGVECIERYSKQQEADREPSSIIEHNILLEVDEPYSTGQQQQQQQVDGEENVWNEQGKAVESFGLSLDQIKQATQKRRVSFGGGISRSASNFSVTTCGEDLEQEFDNEPAFERRQVEVKRNRDVRDEYELGEELGRGRFGTVRKCVEKCENGRQLAAKFVNMRRQEDREDVEREVYIMCLLQHKRLLQLYDAFDNGKDEMCLITELIEGGELFERIIDDDFDLTEKKAAIFMRQICQGVEYMHSQQVVHLDMKPENILCVSKTGNRIKLIDFGLARQLKLDETLRVMFGTPDFAAPEVLAYDVVSFATDMWSVGVICYVLLSGLSPFMGDTDIETMANVTKATYDFDDRAFEPISDLAKDFISKLLVREQNKRLKPSECLQHPWLQRGGIQLEANIRSRRESMVISMQLQNNTTNLINEAMLKATLEQQHLLNDNGDTPPILLSLDKRNLKKYVIRRKWHKTVHAIMALGRMGANLKF